MYSNRENYLVTDNNYPLVVSGTVLYNTDGSLNIMPGQLGIFDAATHIAVTAFSATKNIYLAVGIDTNGDGVAEEVRKSAGDFKGCMGLEATAKGPKGECPEIWDFLFDCTTCEADYGIKVQVDSTRQNAYFADQHYPTFPFNVITDCCGCETCTTEHNCNEIVCKIMDQINQKNSDGQSLLVKKEYDFSVERLYPTISHAALPCVDGACGGAYLCQVTSVSVSYNDVVTVLTLSPAIENPSVAGTMLIGQTKILQNALNALLVSHDIPGSFHVVQKCTNTCYEITLNSCAFMTAVNFTTCTDAVLNEDQDGGITTETPLTVSQPTNCTDCGDAGTEDKTYTCGIRFIGKIFPQECGCFPPAEYLTNRGTRLRVFPTTGFGCNNWKVNQIQELQLAEGQGVDLRWKEFKQEMGGQGRVYAPQVAAYGPLGAHVGRIPESITAQCETYCQYSFKHRINSYNEMGTGQAYYSTLYSIVAIPTADTVTATAFETSINNWLKTLQCPTPAITCGLS